LLQKAYVDARYKKDYTIEKNELEYLEQKVKLLKEMTERICTEKIKGFAGKSKKLKAIYNQYFAKFFNFKPIQKCNKLFYNKTAIF
jgi:hypothetical protein